jgi:hypothetical protein
MHGRQVSKLQISTVASEWIDSLFSSAFTYEHQDALITSIAAKMVEERFILLVA